MARRERSRSDPGQDRPSSSDRNRELPADTRRRFRDGDAEALGEVYDRYAGAVWAVAMRVTRAEPLAQEAAQEAFMRAWRAAGSYDPDRDLGPWLLQIARFSALDVLRRELRPTRGGHEAEQDASVEPPGIERAWVAWAVSEALRGLNESEREIVQLSFYEDLTQVQIADRLGLPVGTVKSRSHRAHRRLAELLAYIRDDDETTDENREGPGRRTPIVTSTGERREAR